MRGRGELLQALRPGPDALQMLGEAGRGGRGRYCLSIAGGLKRLCQAPRENQVALPGIALAGTLIEVWHLLAAAAALGTAAAVALLLGRIGRRAGTGTAE